MKKEVLYSLKSPYREPLDVVGFRFGSGEKSLALVGAMRGNEIQQMYVCSQAVQALKKLEERGEIAEGHEILVVPCVNYYSMNIGKRFWTMDNTDINRMFPGYDLGETTQRIADGVFAQLQGYKYGIQLASFYQEGNFLPHIKMMDTGIFPSELMTLFGMEFGIIRAPRPYDTTTLNYNWQIWSTMAFSMYTNATDTIDR
ncbi:MAG: M14 family metallopeptidase, partial [Oscillospiraceae bacterium]